MDIEIKRSDMSSVGQRYSPLGRILVLGFGAALACAALPAWSLAVYNFTSIAEDETNKSINGGPPGISNDGAVVFSRTIPGDIAGSGLAGKEILTGNGGPLRTVASTVSGQFNSSIFVFDPVISDSGLVAFTAQSSANISLVAIDKNDLVTNIAQVGDPVPNGPGVFDTGGNIGGLSFFKERQFDIADDGTVVFFATLDDGTTKGIYTGSGGALRTFVKDIGVLEVTDDLVAINNAGQQAAFAATFLSGPSLRIGDADGNVDLQISTGSTQFADIESFSLNNNGAVAFTATKDSGERGVFLAGNTGIITTIADSVGPYDSFRDVSVNDFGQVSFIATLDLGGGKGIFTGSDPIANKVFGTGDQLFNSTVGNIFTLGRDAINDSGNIAFVFDASDGGKTTVVRANPIRQALLINPDQLNGFAQLSTGGGTGIGMLQSIPLPSLDTLFDLSFDLDFLTDTGKLSVRLGDLDLRSFFGPGDFGPILFSGINPFDLFDPTKDPPVTVLLNFFLSGPPGSTVRIDDIILPNIINGNFEGDYFEGWNFDTSLGGVAMVSALETPAAASEPEMLSLFSIALVGLGFARRRSNA